MIWQEEKAQGSLEYLLIIAGAIFVAAVVGLFLKSIPGQTENRLNQETQQVLHGF
tara:strand:+ start:1691 stop:1855 length:165 start_codon:yes stop_codon:yes gene_type:complete